MIQNGTYILKDELFPLLHISTSQWDRRKKDLLAWFENFFEYELYEDKRPMEIVITEVYGEYQPLPRAVKTASKEEKLARYEEFTIASLGTEFKPNSKTRIAKDAISAFGAAEYKHESPRSVANAYIKPAVDAHGECNNKYRWCFYSSYTPMDKETEEKWRAIMAEEKISEREAANAFYRHAEGEDISQEIHFYKKAQERFKKEFNDTPVRLADWRLKRTTK